MSVRRVERGCTVRKRGQTLYGYRVLRIENGLAELLETTAMQREWYPVHLLERMPRVKPDTHW